MRLPRKKILLADRPNKEDVTNIRHIRDDI